MQLEYAEWLAGHLVERIKPFLKRVEIAGSIRRKRDEVGDIELVVEPVMNNDLFEKEATPVLDPLRLELQKIGRLVKNGNRYIRVHLTKPDVYADIFVVWPPATWGSIMAIRTGPHELGKYVVTKCKDRGFIHKDGHAIRADSGDPISTDTEAQFFALAGLECPAPEHRDHLAKIVWDR
jgi:DNA polymerase (family 10)